MGKRLYVIKSNLLSSVMFIIMKYKIGKKNDVEKAKEISKNRIKSNLNSIFWMQFRISQALMNVKI